MGSLLGGANGRQQILRPPNGFGWLGMHLYAPQIDYGSDPATCARFIGCREQLNQTKKPNRVYIRFGKQFRIQTDVKPIQADNEFLMLVPDHVTVIVYWNPTENSNTSNQNGCNNTNNQDDKPAMLYQQLSSPNSC